MILILSKLGGEASLPPLAPPLPPTLAPLPPLTALSRPSQPLFTQKIKLGNCVPKNMHALATGVRKKQNVSRHGSQKVSKIEPKILRKSAFRGFASKRWIL